MCALRAHINWILERKFNFIHFFHKNREVQILTFIMLKMCFNKKMKNCNFFFIAFLGSLIESDDQHLLMFF